MSRQWIRLFMAVWLVSLAIPAVYSGILECEVPEDREVLLYSIENNSAAPFSREYTITVGSSTSKSSTRGQQSSSTQSRDSESSSGSSIGGSASVGFAGFGASAQGSSQSGSSQRSGSSSTTGFNWDQTDSSVLNEETTRKDTYTCEPMTICEGYQPERRCGNKIYRPNTFRVMTTPIIPATAAPVLAPPGQPFVSINKPGEYWILAKNLTFLNHTGEWAREESCDPSTFVSGIQVKSSGNKKGLTGITLHCSKNENKQFEKVKEIQSGAGSDGIYYSPFRSSSKSADQYADGFVHQSWVDKDGKKRKGNLKLTFHEQPDYLFLPRGSRSVETIRVKCPHKMALCGLMTMLDDPSKSVITNVGFKCCYFCTPREELVITKTIENNTPTQSDQKSDVTVGTQKESSRTLGGQNSTDDNVSSEGRTLAGLQKGFAATFGSSSSSGYNWGSSESLVSSKSSTDSMSWVCAPRSRCTVKQLVGICGEYKFFTDHRRIETIPLDAP